MNKKLIELLTKAASELRARENNSAADRAVIYLIDRAVEQLAAADAKRALQADGSAPSGTVQPEKN